MKVEKADASSLLSPAQTLSKLVFAAKAFSEALAAHLADARRPYLAFSAALRPALHDCLPAAGGGTLQGDLLCLLGALLYSIMNIRLNACAAGADAEALAPRAAPPLPVLCLRLIAHASPPRPRSRTQRYRVFFVAASMPRARKRRAPSVRPTCSCCPRA